MRFSGCDDVDDAFISPIASQNFLKRREAIGMQMINPAAKSRRANWPHLPVGNDFENERQQALPASDGVKPSRQVQVESKNVKKLLG